MARKIAGTPGELVRAWAEFIGRIPWDWFVTLTFDPKRRYPVSRELASREAYWWCGLVAHVYRRPVGWIYAIERQASGMHHIHILFAGLPEPRWHATVDAWRERNGMITDVQRVSDRPRVAMYASKSVAADGEIVLADTLRRYRSKLASATTADLFVR